MFLKQILPVYLCEMFVTIPVEPDLMYIEHYSMLH
eukprot:UN01354